LIGSAFLVTGAVVAGFAAVADGFAAVWAATSVAPSKPATATAVTKAHHRLFMPDPPVL
jgi:hypothetical protein